MPDYSDVLHRLLKMNIYVSYAQFKNVSAIAGALVRYMDNGLQFRAVSSIAGHPQNHVYDATTPPPTWGVDFPLATMVDAIDL